MRGAFVWSSDSHWVSVQKTMRCFLALSLLFLSPAKSESVDGAGLFVAWAAAVESASEGRMGHASVGLNYQNFVALLPQTKKILESQRTAKAETLKSLKDRYKLVLTKEVETAESDQYLGLLYCSIKGLVPSAVAGCNEAGTYNLDSALGKQLFDVSIENPWKSFFEPDRDRK